MQKDVSDLELNKILQNVDSDQTGQITFSEFLVATLNPDYIFTEARLKLVFQIFDNDGGGSLSVEELKMGLCGGKKIIDDVWTKIFREAEIDID